MIGLNDSRYQWAVDEHFKQKELVCHSAILFLSFFFQYISPTRTLSLALSLALALSPSLSFSLFLSLSLSLISLSRTYTHTFLGASSQQR